MNKLLLQNPIKIAYVGLTHLGLVYSTASAAKGFETIGYDSDHILIKNLSQDQLPINEPGLLEQLSQNSTGQKFKDNISELLQADIIYFSCDIITDQHGNSDYRVIDHYLDQILPVLKSTQIAVILCQVEPGFTRKIYKQYQFKNLFYQVETLVFGQALERALYPERLIIGSADKFTPLPESYRFFLEQFNCDILHMGYESAELAKISINIYLTASVTVANTLSEICEKIDANWGDISDALRLDKRIGQFAYLNPGLGIAGGNLERDLRTVLNLSTQHGTHAELVQACIQNSQYRAKWVLNLLKKQPDDLKKSILILGLAYKENTNSIKNSASIALIHSLESECEQIFVHDPVVKTKLSEKIRVVNDLELSSYIQKNKVIIIMTPWRAYHDLKIECRDKIIIDPYGVLRKQTQCASGQSQAYYCLGRFQEIPSYV